MMAYLEPESVNGRPAARVVFKDGTKSQTLIGYDDVFDLVVAAQRERKLEPVETADLVVELAKFFKPWQEEATPIGLLAVRELKQHLPRSNR
jgi:hypothetical protein